MNYLDGGIGAPNFVAKIEGAQMSWIRSMLDMEKKRPDLRAAWLINVENILRAYGFPRAELLFECGKADIETAATFLKKHGLGFWSKIFCLYAKVRAKCYVQERKWALREKKYDRVFKLMRAYPLFGRKVPGNNEGGDGMNGVVNSLSCRNKMVQNIMEKGFRRLGHILPVEEGKQDNWLDRERVLEKGNDYKTKVVQAIVGRSYLSAFSDGSGRKLCQCMSLGNTIGSGCISEGGTGEISDIVVSTCTCGEACIFEKRFGLGGFFEEEWKDKELAKLNFALRSNEKGPNPSNNVAELKAIERIIRLSVEHKVAMVYIGTDSNFCIRNLKKIKIWRSKRWIDGKGRPIKMLLYMIIF